VERGVDGADLVSDPGASPVHTHAEFAELHAEIARLRGSSRTRVADELLMMFGKIAGILLLASVMLVAVLALFRPETDLSSLTRLIDTQLSLIIGAVLGYAAHPSDAPQ
jgi:hypothetical protein